MRRRAKRRPLSWWYSHARARTEYPMSQHPEAIVAGKKRPFTGAEFLESLRDGREVYIYGDRVKDVTTHPAFRNTARMLARLYNALHDPKHSAKLLVPTD